MPRSQTDTEIEANLAIARIRGQRLAEPNIQEAAVGVVAGLIPFVGGALATILGEYASANKTERVCSMLSSLGDAIRLHHTDPEKHLTKDQIVEVVHDMTQASLTTSDQEKVRLLRNGLGYAFTSGDTFEDKQIFLTVLRSLTTHEIEILRKIYRTHDPYRIESGRPSAIVQASQVATILQGSWRNEGKESGSEGETLVRHLAGKKSGSELWVGAAVSQLDSKGLTAAVSHLSENHKVRFQWITGSGVAGLSQNVFAPIRSHVSDDTPIEASRTEFGSKFVDSFY